METNNSGKALGGFVAITDPEFKQIAKLVYDTFGVNLTDQKKALVTSRLAKVIREMKFSSFGEFHDWVVADTTGQALVTLVNKITTNHTFFFREAEHFRFFTETVLPGLVEQCKAEGSKKIRIWSAGSSSGEEPYTLAMVIREFFGADFDNWDIGILATDISTQVLGHALHGVYHQDRLKELPDYYRNKYFRQTDAEHWEVSEKIRELVLFKRLNFLRPEFPFQNRFHVIFCRNVMIYFDRPTRETLVNKFFRYTEDGGWLFVGHSESLARETCPFRYIRPAVYRKI